MSVERDGGTSPGIEEQRLNSAETALLKEGLLRAARHARAENPQQIVDQFLPKAKFVNGHIVVSFRGEELTARKLMSKLVEQNCN